MGILESCGVLVVANLSHTAVAPGLVSTEFRFAHQGGTGHACVYRVSLLSRGWARPRDSVRCVYPTGIFNYLYRYTALTVTREYTSLYFYR